MHKAIITDLNKCVGCMACSVGCKAVNGVDIGQQWIHIKRVGPYPIEGGSGQFPDVEMYFLPMQCQHCDNPECVTVCPTGASVKAENGTVQIDLDQCIGCQACVSACPYGVRYLNVEKNVVEKCSLCADRIEEGELPQCVLNCVGMAKWFGDLDEGIENFDGPLGKKLGEYVQPYEEADIHHLADSGNGPSFVYILRNHTWQD